MGGLEKVYEIKARVPQRGLDTRHNRVLSWSYFLIRLHQATDYNGMMDLTENLAAMAQEVLGTTKIVQRRGDGSGQTVRRITMVDAVKKYAGVDWNTVERSSRRERLQEHNVEFEERHKGRHPLLFFEEFAESI